MKNNIQNSCGKRGCEITLLPSDSKIKQVNSKKCVIIKLVFDNKLENKYAKCA